MRDRITDMENMSPLPDFDHDWEKEVPYVFGDLAIIIEYLAGDTRTKDKGDGFKVSSVMPAAYGAILRTTDAHGEEIDMYLASMPNREADIYVIDQINPGGNDFDEHKVMLGFDSLDEAVHLYTTVFSDGSGENRVGKVTDFTPQAFLQWLDEEGSEFKPSSETQIDDTTVTDFKGITRAPKPNQPPRDAGGGVVVNLPDLSKGPVVKTLTEATGFGYHLYLYSAISAESWSIAFDTYCRTLELAREGDIAHIHIASPGGSVFLMGRMISAMARTKAHVITYAEGSVASAATTIWSAGHERRILPGAYFMQHMSSQLLVGKTTDIAAKSVFCMNYIKTKLQDLVAMGLFTQEEVDDMADKSADIFISGREAIARMGTVSYQTQRAY